MTCIKQLISYYFFIYLQHLKEADFITDDHLVRPIEAQKSDLEVVHSKKYLKSLKVSKVKLN